MFAEIKNGTVVTFPYDYDTLIQKNPYTKFNQADLLAMYTGTKDNLDGHELVRVTPADEPTFDKQTQKVSQDSAPALVNGVWTLGWSIETLTQEEQDAQTTAQAKSVRRERDAKLAETDWRFRSDMTPSQEWKDYCQALRDVPAQSGFPWTVTFPSGPQ